MSMSYTKISNAIALKLALINCTLRKWLATMSTGKNTLLRSGEFARMTGVTKKALQVYMDKGLLIPDAVDMANGYRYYAKERAAQIEEIVKMREVGLSLDDIKDIFDRKDPLRYLDILHKRLDQVEKSIAQLERDRAILQFRIKNQSMFLNPPALRHCFVEYQPRRAYVRFPINPYQAKVDSGTAWYDALEAVRKSFQENDIPIKYFQNVGAVFDMDKMRDGKIMYSHAAIWPEDAALFDNVEYLEAGYYACMFDQRYMSDGTAIARAVTTLIDFVETSEYALCGDYFEECVAETTMFDFNRMLYVVKEQVPISLDPQSD